MLNSSNNYDEEDNDEDSSCEIISEDDENQLNDLRRLALSSMIKKEDIFSDDDVNIITEVESEIDKKLIECRKEISQQKINLDFQPKPLCNFEIDQKATFLKLSKRVIENDDHFNENIKKMKLTEAVDIVKDFVRSPLKLIKGIEWKEDLSKEIELKNRLSEIYKAKNISKRLTFFNKVNKYCENQNSNIVTGNGNVCNKSVGTLQKYRSNINDNEKSVNEISKSIETLTRSIQEKLEKSRSITKQIESLKTIKSDLHKDINITRSKILDLNKVKKQRIATLDKYKILKKRYELSPISSSNIDKIETLSTISNDTEDSQNNSLDCNQIICPCWINDKCTNEHCGYQHPKVIANSMTKQKTIIKENDKIFLRDMNPLEFLTVFNCEACSSRISLSNIHIMEDWHCKSCCEEIMILTKPSDIIEQLIKILHHFYKRYILTNNVTLENRDNSILKSFIKGTDALLAKVLSVENIPLDLLRITGRHVLFSFCETNRIDDAITFLKTINYDVDLVLFAASLSFPVPIIHRLITDTIDRKISDAIFDGIVLLINVYCKWSAYVEIVSVNNLLRWLELIVKMKIFNVTESVIYALTAASLKQIIGSNEAHCLNLSLSDLQCQEKFWLVRKNLIWKLLELYTINAIFQSTLYLVLNKYWILSLFYTDNEESAIELCVKFAKENFYFKVLLSKLSLNYNYSMVISENCDVDFVEYNYNKSEWLLLNRSEKSCVKILENIIHKIYLVKTEDFLQYYENFLTLERTFDSTISDVTLKICTNDVTSIRKCSSIWMCYINLAVLKGKSEKLSTLVSSNSFLDLPTPHLCRSVQLILNHYSIIYDGDTYFDNVKSIFLTIETYIHFDQFMVLFNSVVFEKLYHNQLSMWLFLVDFSLTNFQEEERSTFLVAMSSKLSDEVTTTSYDIFYHLVLCYQVNVEKVWLNLIKLILNLNLPIYTLIDVCRSAISYVRWSLSLWRHYYKCALDTEDKSLVADVKECASRIGFSF